MLNGYEFFWRSIRVHGDDNAILSLRDRADVTNRWLSERIRSILPDLMAEEDIDTWIISGREYNEDPVLMTLLPAPMLTARRRTILVFHLPRSGDLECLAICRYGLGSIYRGVWDPESGDGWQCVAQLLRRREPRRIGVNVSDTHALADGMTASELEALRAELDPGARDRMVSAERLAVRWLETRSPGEIETYPRIARLASHLIERAFSPEIVHPGNTTTDDVVWWFREEIDRSGLDSWFHPTVKLQAPDSGWDTPTRDVIRRGDLLHCDLGLKYLGLCTDTQRHAYVLRRGEERPPRGIEGLFERANRLQDIVTSEFSSGRTGNQILCSSLTRARMEKIDGRIYTHPLGFHGHAAGPTIGLWDNQDRVPGRGDIPLNPNTCYALELSVIGTISEWQSDEVRIALEESVLFDGESVRFLAGRQKSPYLIR